MIDLDKFTLTTGADVKIIASQEELEGVKHLLELDPKKIFRVYMVVPESNRAAVFVHDNYRTAQPIRYFESESASLHKNKRLETYLPFTALFKVFKDLNCRYTQSQVPKLLAKDIIKKGEEDRRESPFPRMVHTIPIKNFPNRKVLIYSTVLESLLEEPNTEAEITSTNKPNYSIQKFDDKLLQKLARAFPHTTANLMAKLEQVKDCQEEIKALVNLDSDTPITPTTKTNRLTNVSIIHADSSNPTAKQLKSEGTYKFLLGNLGDTEIQVLAEYQNQIDIQYYLNRIDIDDDAYRLFVFPQHLTGYRYYDKYRLENTFKLFKTLFKNYQIQEEYQIRPVKELPVPEDVQMSPNPVEAAIKYYLETGKAISYVHFKYEKSTLQKYGKPI